MSAAQNPRNDSPNAEFIAVDPDTDMVMCDGGGHGGHPQVWYSFDGRDRVVCGYCGRVFGKSGHS